MHQRARPLVGDAAPQFAEQEGGTHDDVVCSVFKHGDVADDPAQAEAGLLGEGLASAQALDPFAESLPVLVSVLHLQVAVSTGVADGNPVGQLVGEQGQPFLQLPAVEQMGLVVEELADGLDVDLPPPLPTTTVTPVLWPPWTDANDARSLAG